jgi:hypothetical protein
MSSLAPLRGALWLADGLSCSGARPRARELMQSHCDVVTLGT